MTNFVFRKEKIVLIYYNFLELLNYFPLLNILVMASNLRKYLLVRPKIEPKEEVWI
jgi:hypothetical protein